MTRKPGGMLVRACCGLIVLLLAACGAQAPADGATDNPNEPVMSGSDAASGQATGSPTMVQGRVVDAAGSPLAGVLVVPQSTDQPPQPVPEIAVQTGADGTYQWTLPPGSYTLLFNAQGFAPTTADVVIPDGQVVTADVTLQP